MQSMYFLFPGIRYLQATLHPCKSQRWQMQPPGRTDLVVSISSILCLWWSSWRWVSCEHALEGMLSSHSISYSCSPAVQLSAVGFHLDWQSRSQFAAALMWNLPPLMIRGYCRLRWGTALTDRGNSFSLKAPEFSTELPTEVLFIAIISSREAYS